LLTVLALGACAPLVESGPSDGRTVLGEVSIYGVANAGEVEATAAEVDLSEEQVVVGTDVEVSVSSAIPLSVSAEHSVWEMSSLTASFSGSVVATRGQFSIECDELLVEYSSESEVTRATATGGVSLSRGEWSGSAETANLDLVEGVVTLSGNSSIDGSGNRLQGTSIRVFMANERVECDDCTMVVLTPELD
jgi:lipopolysaccharide transport protein LptA